MAQIYTIQPHIRFIIYPIIEIEPHPYLVWIEGNSKGLRLNLLLVAWCNFHVSLFFSSKPLFFSSLQLLLYQNLPRFFLSRSKSKLRIFPNMQLHCDDDISQLRPYFEDPNGRKLDVGVANLPSNF